MVVVCGRQVQGLCDWVCCQTISKVVRLKTLSPVIKIFDTDPLTDPLSCEGILEGCTYVLHVTPLFHTSVRDRQKEYIEPSLQEAEFVMRAAVEANITWTVTTSLTAAVGFLQILTNTATKLRVPKWVTSDGYQDHRHEEPN